MAGADYRSCDVCGGKTFYDAGLNYEYTRQRDDPKSFRVGGCALAKQPAALAVPEGGFAIVPADALREVIRISDRSHPAWDAVKAAMLAAAERKGFVIWELSR